MAQFNIPGVYSKIDASAAVRNSGPVTKVIGIVATGTSNDEAHKLTNIAYAPFSFKDAEEKYGEDSNIVKLMSVCIANGASKFIVVRAAEDLDVVDYKAALAAAELEEAIDIVIMDSDNPLDHVELKNHAVSASDNRRERIGIVGFDAGTDFATVINQAKALNSGKVYTSYPNALDNTGTELSGIYTAAALAGQIAAETDPSMPMTNVQVNGFYGLAKKLKDDEINSLIEAGVIPLEVRSGEIRIVRAVSTYTKDATGNTDITWQELTTTLITHHILKDMRRRLTSAFSRAKQTAETRDAIKSEVLTALLEYQAADYIEDVKDEDVSIEINPHDPFRNDVDFVYNVTGPVNVIFLTGHLVI